MHGMAKKAEKTENKPETKAKETPTDAPDTGTPPPKDSPPSDKPESKAPVETKKRYVFPRQGDIKCPGCGLYETVATSTQGAIQSRKCTRAIPTCGETFSITGKEVKFTDCKKDI